MKRWAVKMVLEDDGVGPNGERGMYLGVNEIRDWLTKELITGLVPAQFTITEIDEDDAHCSQIGASK